MKQPAISNALLRCTRPDDLAKDVFEHVNPELNLWVLELPNTLPEIIKTLSDNERLLNTLAIGSSDFTLHISSTFDKFTPFIIPPSLALLSGTSCFQIELYETH